MDYSEFQRELIEMKRCYPSLKTEVFGCSWLGRSLHALHLGSGRQSVLLAGAVHGMEHLTTDLLMRYTQELLKEPILPCQVTIVPMVNPDGVAIETGGIAQAGRFAPLVRRVSKGDTHCWQANGRGVDLNHNFDAGWQDLRQREIAAGITEPAPTRFGGYYPESEPESHGLAQLCRREQFSMAAVLHSQGEEIYWKYGKHTPRCSLEIAHAMEAVSGYRVAEPEGLAVGGGMKDWFLEEFHRPAFTIEVGKGENPLPHTDLDAIYERVKPMLDVLISRK